MIALADRVVTKKIGPPIVGSVVGIVKGEAFEQLWSYPLKAIISWEEFYPDWQKHDVVTLEFESPAFLYSLDQLYEYTKKSLKRKVSIDEVRQVLDLVKMSRFAHFPSPDLELL